MTVPKYARGENPPLCWSRKPGGVWHCTEPELHEGDHHHAYTRSSWPQLHQPERAEARSQVGAGSHGV